MGDYKGRAQVYHEVCCQTLMEQDGICPFYITGAKCLWAYRRFDTDGNAWPCSNKLKVSCLYWISINRSPIK